MLDTETTGLKDDDEVIEIALSDCATGYTVFNSLIYSDKESNPYAFKVNNITKEMLDGQPTIDKVWEQIEAVVGNRVILASNAPFDERLLNQSLRKYDLTCSFIWADIQTLYRNYSCQGDASKYPLKTIGMCKQLKVEAGTHRALNDVQAQIRLLRAMANSVIPDFDI
jgi:DNA polymerase-3 subunit epsilon